MKLVTTSQHVRSPIVHVAKQNRYGYWNPSCGHQYNREPITFDGPHEWVNCQECLWREGLRDRPNKRWNRPSPPTKRAPKSHT